MKKVSYANARWSFLKPTDFTDYLFDSGMLKCQADDYPCMKDDPIYQEFERLVGLEKGGRTKKYRAAYRKLVKRISTPYMMAARGLSGVMNVQNLALLTRARYDNTVNVSMNVYASAASFSGVDRRRGGDSVLMIFKLPSSKINSFGDDSESGPLFEAEIKALECWECVDRIYVMSKDVAGKLATDAERRAYGLSAYLQCGRFDGIRGDARRRPGREIKTGGPDEGLITALPLDRLADVKKLGLDCSITTKPPAGWKWYRLM